MAMIYQSWLKHRNSNKYFPLRPQIYQHKLINPAEISQIVQYNQKVNINFNSDDQFYAYYRDIARHVKINKLIFYFL